MVGGVGVGDDQRVISEWEWDTRLRGEPEGQQVVSRNRMNVEVGGRDPREQERAVSTWVSCREPVDVDVIAESLKVKSAMALEQCVENFLPWVFGQFVIQVA